MVHELIKWVSAFIKEELEQEQNGSWAKAPPFLFLLWLGIYHCRLNWFTGISGISLVMEESGWIQRYTVAVHQNSQQDNDAKYKAKANKELFLAEEVKYPWLGESVTWSLSDCTLVYLLRTRVKAERPNIRQELYLSSVKTSERNTRKIQRGNRCLCLSIVMQPNKIKAWH